MMTATIIPVLHSLQTTECGTKITRNLRHFNIHVREGDLVTLENLNEGLHVEARVAYAGGYDENTVFIVE